MAEDVWLRDHIPYVNELNRLGTAYRLAQAGHALIARAPVANALMTGAPFDKLTWLTEYDYIVDYARIAMGYENYVKGLLLLKQSWSTSSITASVAADYGRSRSTAPCRSPS
jgi:hypothetical protein